MLAHRSIRESAPETLARTEAALARPAVQRAGEAYDLMLLLPPSGTGGRRGPVRPASTTEPDSGRAVEHATGPKRMGRY